VSIVESPVVDPTERYSIPITTLTAAWKTTSVSATLYENQTLHTFGATVEDRTGYVVKGVVGTALSIARIGVGAPTAAKGPALCQPGVYKALDVVREGQAKLLDPSVDETARARWSGLVVAARASLQITETYNFDPTPEKPALTGQPAPTKLLAWFVNPQLIASARKEDQVRFGRTTSTAMRVNGVPTTVAPIPAALKSQGIIYREPAPVIVQVCPGSCDESAPGQDGPEVLATLQTQAAQFGRYAAIPLVNKGFQKNNLALSFAANGRLESFTYGSESSLEKMATTLSESALSIEGYAATRKAARTAAAEAAAGAELKTLTAETELLRARAEKIEAEARLANLLAGK
jgi:hypothetical protein